MSTLTQFFGGSTGIPAELLVIGGGGAGGGVDSQNNSSGGGGGAGELIYYSGIQLVKGTTYTITVGGGGAGASGAVGGVGSKSSVNELIAGGGGGGAFRGTTSTPSFGSINSGSGGGGSGGSGSVDISLPGAFASTISSLNPALLNAVAISAANKGGDGIRSSTTLGVSGGGGGSGGAASNAISNTVFAAAPGRIIAITGADVTYAAGGPGKQADGTASTGTNATANTGNGASGASSAGGLSQAGGNGGSGIVIITYPDTYAVPTAITGTYTTPTRTGYRVYRFTASGSITLPS